jgi:hypothetical protein
MSQTSYAIDQAVAFAGMKVDSMDDHVESFIADEAIPFGRGVSGDAGDVTGIQLPKNDVSTSTFDIAFEASNVINLKINGTAIAPVTYASSNANTYTLLAAACLLVTGVTRATVDASAKTLVVECDGVTTVISNVVVTGGTNQAVATITNGSDDVFRGIALHQHNEKAITTGIAQYELKDAVSVLRKGKVWVETGVAVTADDPAYVDFSGGIGKFTNVSTNNLTTGGKFRSTVSGAGLAQLELNLP